MNRVVTCNTRAVWYEAAMGVAKLPGLLIMFFCLEFTCRELKKDINIDFLNGNSSDFCFYGSITYCLTCHLFQRFHAVFCCLEKSIYCLGPVLVFIFIEALGVLRQNDFFVFL